MAILGKYFQDPDERKRYEIDYEDWLDTGELVSSVTFEVTPSTGTPVVIDGTAIDPDSKGIVFHASEGSAGTTYKVYVTMTSSNGQIKQDTVQFTIKAQ